MSYEVETHCGEMLENGFCKVCGEKIMEVNIVL